ncbi:MAG: 6-phosphogluconolactonase [Pseudomonadota bacterium]
MNLWDDHDFPNFEVLICDNLQEISDETDWRLSEQFEAGARNFMIGIGRTQYPLFDLWKSGNSPFSKFLPLIKYIHGDEYLGLKRDDHRRLLNEMNSRLGIIGKINKATGFEHYQRITFNDAMDPDQAALSHEWNIDSVGGIDSVATGVGEDGHIFFNPPGTSFDSRSRRIKLWPDVMKQNEELLEGATQPTEALTVGLGTITDAEFHNIMVHGEHKAQAMAVLFKGIADPQWPVTYLHALDPETKKVKIIADRAAMSLVL